MINRHPERIYQLVVTPDGHLKTDPQSTRMCGISMGVIWGIATITALVAGLVIHSRAPHFTCQLVTSAIGSNATASGLYVPCTKVPS